MAKGGGGLEAGVILLVLVSFILYYAAIAIGIAALSVAVIWGIYILIRELYVGSIKQGDTKDVLTKASKYIYKHKKEPISSFRSRLQLDEPLYAYLLDQMKLAGIIEEKNNELSRSLSNTWSLGPIFKAINQDNDYFNTRIHAISEDVKTRIAKQVQNEKDEITLSILSSYSECYEHILKLEHLKVRERYIITTGDVSEINKVSTEISEHDAQIQCKRLNISCDSSMLPIYMKFITSTISLNNSGLWSNVGKVRLNVMKADDCVVSINNNTIDIPLIEIDNYTLYLLPHFMLEVDDLSRNKVVRLIEWKNVRVSENQTTHCLEHSNWFSDHEAEYAYRSWLHQRVNGGPDLRYSYNPSFSYYYIQEISVSDTQLDILSGSRLLASNFISALKSLKQIPQKAPSCPATPETLSFDNLQSNNLCSSELMDRIKMAISMGNISKSTIYNKSLVSILNDYQVFLELEDKVFARILKSALDDGTMERIISQDITSKEEKLIIERFVLTSGYDEQKAKSIILAIKTFMQ